MRVQSEPSGPATEGGWNLQRGDGPRKGKAELNVLSVEPNERVMDQTRTIDKSRWRRPSRRAQKARASEASRRPKQVGWSLKPASARARGGQHSLPGARTLANLAAARSSPQKDSRPALGCTTLDYRARYSVIANDELWSHMRSPQRLAAPAV